MGMKPDFSGPISENSSNADDVIPKVIDPNCSSLQRDKENSEESESESDSSTNSEQNAESKFSSAARPKGETSEQKRVSAPHWLNRKIIVCALLILLYFL